MQFAVHNSSSIILLGKVGTVAQASSDVGFLKQDLDTLADRRAGRYEIVSWLLDKNRRHGRDREFGRPVAPLDKPSIAVG